MARRGEQTRRHIVRTAYRLYYRDGFASVGVDDIAEAAGVTKRTLYYHFESKQTLLAAVLDSQSELILEQIQRWAGPIGQSPAETVQNLFAEYGVWARRARWRGSGFTRAAMEFARSPGHPARIAARRHKEQVEAWLAGRFAAGGIKSAQMLARQVMLLMEGCHALVLIHGDATYADAALAAGKRLVAASD
jgi:AcrR family transcriptional regulator